MAIAKMKENLFRKKEASDLFGIESGKALKGILGSINQSFDKKKFLTKTVILILALEI